MINQNQMVLDATIGLANYDIGHVFGTKGGGLAGVGVMCSTAKAWGATGLTSPVGDVFDVAYVCHEIGHQFNAPHTFNSCGGNGGSVTGYEPGSGTTIMGYAGLCGSDNVQFETDYFFHSGSYERMVNEGNDCAEIINTGNQIPTIQTLDNQGLTIPISTPFTLKGTGNDADGDVLSYSWEQIDIGPVSSLGQPSGNAPLFRFFPPIGVAERTFPRIADIVNNISSPAEVLPTYSRAMNFRLIVRDGKQGANYADYSLDVTASAGPFVVTQPNAANIEWEVGQNQTITWDVANTNQAPVNCNSVDILLSVDGGISYPVTLASAVPNTGSANITVPNYLGNNNRIKVAASENVFFDISNTNFKIIEPSTPTILMTPLVMGQIACGNSAVSYTLNIQSTNGLNNVINLTTQNLPTGVVASFSPNVVMSNGTTVLKLQNLNNVPVGTHEFEVTASAIGVTNELNLGLEIIAAPDEVSIPIAPLNEAVGVANNSFLVWKQVDDADAYELELAANPAFGNNNIAETTMMGTSFELQNLTPLTVYYWRVKAMNDCGEGDFSPIYSFQTAPPSTTVYTSTEAPHIIESATTNAVTSTITIPDNHNILDVNVKNVSGKHTYVSDLVFFLTNPSGNSVQLLSPICGDDENFNLGFDDEALTATVACPPTSGDLYRPVNMLSAFDNTSSQGDWKLSVIDNYAQDGGSLDEWSLEIERAPPDVAQPFVLNNNGLFINQGEEKPILGTDITIILPGHNAADVQYILTSLPQKGQLIRAGSTLAVGALFTQQDVNEGKVNYKHNGATGSSDSFQFDVISASGGWLANNDFMINIQGSSLILSAKLDKDLDCHNGATAQISATASGSTAPYEYRINGGNFQNSGIFNNLSAGTYTISVRDATGLEIQANTITISNPLAINMSLNTQGNDLTIVASGGTGTLQYSIDGTTYQTSNVFADLPNDDYIVYTKDANNCTVTEMITILENPLNTTPQIENRITCATTSDGKVRVIVSGGTPPYSYTYDNVNFQETDTFDDLPAGTYTFTVYEFEGFSKTSAPVVLTAPPTLESSATVYENTITASSTGGVGGHRYSLDDVTYQTSPVFENLDNGAYTVWTRDDNQCKTTTTVTVAINSLIAVGVVDFGISCHNEADGQISVLANSGTAPYSYSIDGITFQNSSVFSNLTPGVYTFTVKDADGFILETNPITLPNPLLLSLNVSVSGNNIIAVGSGGIGNLVFSIDGQNWQDLNSFSNLPNGTYTVFVKDENDCIDSKTVVIDEITTAVDNLFEEHSFEVFPNPNQGVFSLQINESLTKDLSVRIFNTQGKLLFQQQLQNLNPTMPVPININHFSNGVYQLVLSDGEKIGTKRILLVR